MKQEIKLLKQPFIPVILGANIGVYSTARAFHEAYGTKSISISRELTGPIKNSVILQPIIEPNMENEFRLLDCLNQIMQSYPGTPKILIGSDDWHVEMIIKLRDQLVEEWVVPYTTYDILHSVTNKFNFYKLCEELGVDYPKYLALNESSAENLELPFDFPIVIKPANCPTYELVEFTGKKKAYIAENRHEFEHIISLIRGGDYTDTLILQEYVPGDDTAMYILTLYTAQDGETKLASFGQTLLEDHTPGGIGNPLVTAEGHNTIEYYVKDYLYNEPLSFSIAENEILYSIVPKRLLLKHIKQKKLNDHVKTLYKSRRSRNPMNYFSVEKSVKRFLYVILPTYNFYRKLKKYPPL